MKVSVVMVTYGHDKFIEKAINSILVQECTFDYELIIANDCSPDKTDSIIQSIIKNHPNNSKIKYLKQKSNVGMMPNFIFALSSVKGKYIALCDGDDYWTDPLKLQKQVSFLDENPNFSICFTDFQVFHEQKKIFSQPDLIAKHKSKSTFSRSSIILDNFIPTLTAVYRNNNEILSYITKELFPADWFVHILNSKYGKIKFLPFKSAVYRKHDGGVCSSSNPIDNNNRYIKSIDLFKSQFKDDFKLQFLFMIVKSKIRFQTFKMKLINRIKNSIKS